MNSEISKIQVRTTITREVKQNLINIFRQIWACDTYFGVIF